jgi:hypothetical protein
VTVAGFLLSTSPTPPPLDQPAAHVAIPELVVGSVLAILGLRSLVRWLRVEFVADAFLDQFLYSLHVAARVGLWFAFAGFFFGLALVDQPRHFAWYLLVPLALAGLQLVTAVALGGGLIAGPRGNGSTMDAARREPGPLEPEKRGETADPGHAQPEAAEVESARVLANQARSALRQAGFTDEEIRTLADEYIALDRGEGLSEFVTWATARRRPVR